MIETIVLDEWTRVSALMLVAVMLLFLTFLRKSILLYLGCLLCLFGLVLEPVIGPWIRGAVIAMMGSVGIMIWNDARKIV